MISRKNILPILSFNIVLLCVVNYLALPFLWYYRIWWFDMPMHFWGGAIVLLLLVYTFYPLIQERTNPFSMWLIGVFIIGVGWEIFEYLMQIFVSHTSQIILDTLSDICFDMAGGCVALIYVTRR